MNACHRDVATAVVGPDILCEEFVESLGMTKLLNEWPGVADSAEHLQNVWIKIIAEFRCKFPSSLQLPIGKSRFEILNFGQIDAA
jgi:hypothetical protein